MNTTIQQVQYPMQFRGYAIIFTGHGIIYLELWL